MGMSKWEKMDLNDVCEVITCGVAARPEYVDEGIPFLSSKNVKENRFILKHFNCVSKTDFEKLTKHNKPEKGDVLYTRVGSFGEAAVIDLDFEFAIFVSLTLIKPKRKILDSRFLMHYLNSPKIKHIAVNSTSGIGVQNLNVKAVRRFPINLPPLAIQKQIAELLDTADALRRQTQAQLDQLDALAQSVFLEMFGDFIDNERYLKPLIEVTKFIDYRGKTPTRIESGVPLISAKCVRKGYFNESRLDFISDEVFEKIMTRGFPKPNEVLFTTEGATMGFTCRIPRHFSKFAVGQRIITLRCKEELKEEYLDFILNDGKFQIDFGKRVTGSAAQGIRSKELAKITIPIPPLTIQTQFTEIIENIEQQKEQLESSLRESEGLFGGLLQEVFG